MLDLHLIWCSASLAIFGLIHNSVLEVHQCIGFTCRAPEKSDFHFWIDIRASDDDTFEVDESVDVFGRQTMQGCLIFKPVDCYLKGFSLHFLLVDLNRVVLGLHEDPLIHGSENIVK